MNRAIPQLRTSAKHLMDHDASRYKATAATAGAPFQVTDKLRPHLATLMGNSGFRALLSRALALASAEDTQLRGTHVKDDGTLAGLEGLVAQLEPSELRECEVLLLAHVFGLLVAFIGPGLTTNVIREVWPRISPDDINFDIGVKNDKAT